VDLFHAREHLHDLARKLEFMLLDRKEEWLAARLTLLEQEKELTRRSDDLTIELLELEVTSVEDDLRVVLLDAPVRDGTVVAQARPPAGFIIWIR